MTTTEQYKKLNAAQRKEDLLQTIRGFLKKHARTPKIDELGHTVQGRAKLLFGSWSKAIQAATDQVTVYRTNWTDDDLIRILQEIHKRTGHFPTTRDVEAIKGSLKKTISTRFGNLAKANERALGTSPRIVILKALAKLTPPGCSEATTPEIQHELGQFTKTEIGCHLDDARREGFVVGRKFGKEKNAWSLTDKGRHFLKIS